MILSCLVTVIIVRNRYRAAALLQHDAQLRSYTLVHQVRRHAAGERAGGGGGS